MSATTAISTPNLIQTPPASQAKDYTTEKIIALISAIAFTKLGIIGTFFALALLEPIAIPFVATLGICLLGGAAIGLGAYFATFYILKAISDPEPDPTKVFDPDPQWLEEKIQQANKTSSEKALATLEEIKQNDKSSMQKNFDDLCIAEIAYRKQLTEEVEKITKKIDELKLDPSIDTDPLKASNVRLKENLRDIIQTMLDKRKTEENTTRQLIVDLATSAGINIDRSAEVKYGLV